MGPQFRQLGFIYLHKRDNFLYRNGVWNILLVSWLFCGNHLLMIYIYSNKWTLFKGLGLLPWGQYHLSSMINLPKRAESLEGSVASMPSDLVNSDIILVTDSWLMLTTLLSPTWDSCSTNILLWSTIQSIQGSYHERTYLYAYIQRSHVFGSVGIHDNFIRLLNAWGVQSWIVSFK